MPVLVTIATINALFRTSANGVSFLDPDALRAHCSDVIEDTDTRERALEIAGELQRLAREYEDRVTAAVDLYLAESRTWDSSATGLIELLEPMDSDRVRTLQDIIQVRQSMLDILTAEQWQRVFS